jgi:hypothetical protein
VAGILHTTSGLRFSPDPVLFRPPQANAPRIYFHFTDKYLYAGFNDVEFIRQVLW